MAARDGADKWSQRVEAAKRQGDAGLARDAQLRADGERARMHSLLGELGQLEVELRELERAVAAAPRSAPRPEPTAAPPPPRPSAPRPPPAAKAPPAPTVDDELAALKRKMAQTPRKKP
jgi:hypothetical protein